MSVNLLCSNSPSSFMLQKVGQALSVWTGLTQPYPVNNMNSFFFYSTVWYGVASRLLDEHNSVTGRYDRENPACSVISNMQIFNN